MYERSALRIGEPLPHAALPAHDRYAIEPREVVALLLGNKAGIAATVAACLLAALAFLLLAPPSYIASTQIIIDPTDLRAVDNSLRAQTMMGDTQIAQVEDEVRVITSSDVLRRVVDMQHLVDDPEFVGDRTSLLSRVTAAVSALVKRSTDEPHPETDAVRALAKAVSAKREERSFVVTVTLTTHEAEKSARLADAIASAFLHVATDKRTNATRRVADSLGGSLDGLRQNVETAEQAVVDFKAKNNIVAAVGQSVAEQQLASASTRLGEIRNQVSEAQSRYAQAQQAQRSGDIGAVPEAIASTTIGGLRAQLTEVMRREGDLAATLGERHPALNEVRAQERTVKAALHGELVRIVAVLKSNLERTQADLASAQSNYKALEATVTSRSQLSVHLGELERAAQANRAIYESFLSRAREVGEQERINTANISVISPAQVPEARSWPPRPIIVLPAALVLGLMLGAGLTLALEFMSRRGPMSGWFPTPQTAR